MFKHLRKLGEQYCIKWKRKKYFNKAGII